MYNIHKWYQLSILNSFSMHRHSNPKDNIWKGSRNLCVHLHRGMSGNFSFLYGFQEVTELDFSFWGATKVFPWGAQDFDQLQMWVSAAGHERVEGPADPEQRADQGCRKGCCGVRTCRREGTDFDFGGGGNMCRRFDLRGSEHDNYYLPSKKLTTALRTSKHLCPFYYIIRPTTSDGSIWHRLTHLTPSKPQSKCRVERVCATQTSTFLSPQNFCKYMNKQMLSL